MKKKSKKLLDSSKLGNYFLVVLFVVAGFLTSIIIGSGNRNEILTNSRNLKEGEYAVPNHHKDREDNGDGTYKLSLDVEGSAKTETQPSKANVLIVYDLSGSMRAPVDESATGRYGADSNGNAIKLYTRSGTNQYNYTYTEITNDTTTGNVYYCSGNNGSCNQHAQYNGTRYLNVRNMKAEKVAHDFSAALLAKNTQYPDTVQMALVTFSGASQTNASTSESEAQLAQNWTNSATFANSFSDTGTSVNLSYGGGTNWEAAMRRAYTTVQSARKNVPTFVVFITDGAPTFRLTRMQTYYDNRNTSYYGHGTSTFDDLINYRQTIDEVRNIGNYNNSTTSTPVKTTLFGIYAFGNEGDLLDDLIYAGNNNGTDRTPQTGTTSEQYNTAKATTATQNYYNASSSAALDQAMEDIFTNIANTLGVGSVSIEDGTTNKVATSTGVAELLEVDETSYEYWLSMDAPNNEVKRKNLLTGAEYTISLTDNGDGTITATSDAFSAPVTVEGTLKLGTFKYKWTEANSLYNFDPPAAEFNHTTGAVDWDLNELGTLLNGVTYTVTFDVYASQETYDLVTDFKNGVVDYNGAYTEAEYNNLPATSKKYYSKDNDSTSPTYGRYVLDPNIKKYLTKDGNSYSLETNTAATLTYTDTRNEGQGEQTEYYNDLEPIPAVSSEMDVTKKWLNDLDRRDAADQTIDLYLLKDGSRIVTGGTTANPTYEKITVNEGNEWYNSKYISTGSLKLIKDANNNITGIQVLAPGHDYSLEEIGGITYYWELQIETVHPMLINGELTTLIEVTGADIPEAMNNASTTYCTYNGYTFYKINGKVYYARALGVANLFAYNNRKSNINVKKVVTGDAPEGKKFTFQYKIHNVGDNEVWFSVVDKDGQIVMEPEVSDNVQAELDSNNQKNGYYYVVNTETTDQTFTVKMEDGWNIRFINLGTGSTYEVTELALDDPFVIEDINATTIISSTRVLPVGATPIEGQEGKYQYGNTIYTEKQGTDAEGTMYTYYEYEYTADINKPNRKITGSVVAPNTSYQMTYTNNYPKSKLVVKKIWFKNVGPEVTVQLYEDGSPAEDEDGAAITGKLNASNNWTYTFENLPVKKDGKVVSYSAKEIIAEGFNYKDTYKGTENIEISASDIPEGTTEVKATVTIDGEETEVTMNEANDWAATLTGIEYVNSDGSLKTVSIESTSQATISYVFTDRTVEVTNSELTTATVTKVWDDATNQDAIRPGSVRVALYADGKETGKTADVTTATPSDSLTTWTYTFEGLDKYNADGTEIVYTFDEVVVPEGYTKTVSDDGLTITNKHTPETTTATVKKVWSDGQDQDAIRPASLKVTLSNGTEVTLNAQNNWEATVEGLPKYDHSTTPINYTWTEEALPEGYTMTSNTTSGTITTITNSHTPETTTATVKKVWNDNGDQDAIRPTSLKVTLSNGTEVTLNAQNNWEATVEDLPKYNHSTTPIEYTWTEESLPEGYTMTSNTTSGTITTITNSHTPETTTATVKKVWDDNGDQDAIRPGSLKVTLSNGTEVTLNAQNNWETTVEGLPKYDHSTTPIVYTWTEEALPEGYTMESNSAVGTVTTITNKHIPETTTATVKKVWDDADDQDGKRPTSLKVTLSNGTEVTLNAQNNWEATVEDLPKYDHSTTPINYTWTEDSLPEGYTMTSNDTVGTITTITNSYDPETTSLTVKKVWEDANNQDGKRPTSLKVTLSDGTEVTLNAQNNWEATVTGKPVYANGQKIEYTWTEDSLPEGYTMTSNTASGTITTITNEYTPETTSLTVKKVWNDGQDQDAIRPTSLKVTLSDGTEVTLNASNNWEATVTEKPVYANGQKIEYTWTEESLPEGYTMTSNTASGTVTTITNSHTPETTTATVKKVWNDNGDQDAIRPASLKVTLSNGTEVTLNAANNWEATVEDLPKYDHSTTPIVYTWTEEALPEGYTMESNNTVGTVTTITNKHIPETTTATVKKVWEDANNQDGKRPASLKVTLSDGTEVTLNAQNNWEATVEDLPKYDHSTTPINYTWTEESLPEGYTMTSNTASGTITTITNSYEPETTSLTVKKVWEDANNQDGKRPTSLKVTLSDGTEVTLNAANNWTATVDNKPVYANGQKIEYTWTEDSLPEGYTMTSNTASGTITTITNEYIPETTSLTVKKVWNDGQDQDAIRPASLKVTLSDGTEVTLNDKNNWEATVDGKPVYANGQKIEYTWTEESLPEGYTMTSNTVSGTVTTITNSHTPETTTATVKKVWNDSNNQDGKRPTSLTVTLSNGTEVTLNAQNNWTATVEDLPKYDHSTTPIEYTWTEGEMPEGYELTDTSVNGTITTLTNSRDFDTTAVSGTKTWSDGQNQDGNRPTSITVRLYADGTEVAHTEVTADDNWSYSFTDLPKNKDEGTLIIYTIDEDPVSGGYAKVVTGYDITNSYTPKTTDITVNKKWVDGDNQDGIRDKYTVKLTGETEDGRTVTIENAEVELPAGVTSYTWNGLPEYNQGSKITYTAIETVVPEGYTESYSTDKLTITNTHPPKKDVVVATKVWDDENNRDGKRPENITLHLFADGTEVTNVTQPTPVKDGNTWTFTYENLPVYRDGGIAIVYTVTEDNVTDYQGSPDGLTITNKHTPELISIPVTKQWVDNNNQDGKRTSITVELYADGVKYDSITLSTSDADTDNSNLWRGEFTELPKYREDKVGEPIEYTIKEVADILEGEEPLYTGSINGFDIVNTHVPSKKVIEGEKKWSDDDNRDDLRPESITVNLLVNGEVIDSQVVSEATEWKYKFENLPEYENGNIIPYQVDESEIPDGYSKTVDNYIITNSHTPTTVDINGTKSWDDADDQDGLRPESITVNLLADGEVIDSAVVNEESDWAFSFTGLPEYEHGKVGHKISYTVTEETVEGYEAVIPEGSYTITNKHTPETVTYIVSKSWDDEEDNDRIRPDSITVKLLADGVKKESVKLSESNNWTHKFGPLDKNKAGKAIEYTIEEEEVAGYELIRSTPKVENKTITEVLTNKHTPEKTSISGKKTWVDENDKAGKRPKNITVYVYADGVKIATLTVSADTDWEYELQGLYKLKEGQEIIYTIEELPIEDYETTYNGYNITNTYVEVQGEEEETPPDTYAADEAVYRIEYLGMLIGAFVVTSLKRTIKF